MNAEYTIEEQLAVVLAHEFTNNDVAFTGLVTGDQTALFAAGIPLAAAVLAQKTHAPDMTVMMAGWLVNPDLSAMRTPPVSEFDPVLLSTPCDAIGQRFPGVMNPQRGDVTVGFSSAAQIDRAGSLNTYRIDLPDGGFRGLVGPILVPEHMTLFGREFVMMPRHTTRTFVERVDYRCSAPATERATVDERYGCTGAGPTLVVTPRCIFEFDADGHMIPRSIHGRSSVTDIAANTGFALPESTSVPLTPEPDPGYLEVLRNEVDPHGIILRGGRPS